jgi:hypothetical protein
VRADGFSTLAPVRATITCGDERHEVVWSAGTLRAPAHADPEGERALAGLGGPPCRCIELLDSWQRHAADPLVLILGPRGDEPLGPREPTGFGPRWLMTSAVDPSTMDPLDRLLSLEGELPRRLVATVVRTLAERADPAAAAALEAALYGRLLAAVQRWSPPSPELYRARPLGDTRDGAWPQLTLAVSDGRRRVTRRDDGGLNAELPLDWLTEVWVRGLEVHDGELTLAARPTPAGGLELDTVDRTLTPHTRRLPAP